MDSKRTSKQFECFTKMTQLMKQDSILQHVYNSAGLLSSWVRNEPIRFGCRPGLSLYGVYPEILDLDQSQIKQIQSLDLRPVMTLKSEVIMFNKVKTGERVSYGGTWEARRDSIVGVVPIGYADGFFRSFSNCGVVLYRGKRAPVVGTVCMDYTLIDLTDILKGENGIVGEPVTLFGDQKGERLSIDEVAKIGNTIPYEIMTAIGRRVPRKSI